MRMSSTTKAVTHTIPHQLKKIQDMSRALFVKLG